MFIRNAHVKYFILCKEPPKKKFMKVTRWEEKLFNVLVDPIKESIDERKIESRVYAHEGLFVKKTFKTL